MIASLVLFFLFIIVYIVISDIITVFFRLTGLTEEKARFQVISLLTNSGFTTQESEAVVSTKIRRRLARATMLFGYAFTVTIVSTTVNFFMTLEKAKLNSLIIILPVLIAILTAFNLIRHSSLFRTKFDGIIEKLGSRIMFGKNANSVLLVEDYGSTAVAHIYLHTLPEGLRDKPLRSTQLMSKHNIMVMTVKRPNEKAVQAHANTVLKEKDIITVLGRKKAVREVFEKGCQKNKIQKGE